MKADKFILIEKSKTASSSRIIMLEPLEIEQIFDYLYTTYKPTQIRLLQHHFNRTSFKKSKLYLCVFHQNTETIQTLIIKSGKTEVFVLFYDLENVQEGLKQEDQFLKFVCDQAAVVRSKPGFVPNWNIKKGPSYNAH